MLLLVLFIIECRASYESFPFFRRRNSREWKAESNKGVNVIRRVEGSIKWAVYHSPLSDSHRDLMENSSLEKDSQQICQVSDWMFGFGPKHHVKKAKFLHLLNAHNLIKRHLGTSFAVPLDRLRVVGSNPLPPPGRVEAH